MGTNPKPIGPGKKKGVMGGPDENVTLTLSSDVAHQLLIALTNAMGGARLDGKKNGGKPKPRPKPKPKP